MKHWRPEDEFVSLQPADRRERTKTGRNSPATTSSGPEPAHVGLALVAAASLGLGCAVYAAFGFNDSFAGEEVVATIPYFGDCPSGGGRNCVISGDTFDLAGEKIRVAGIEAPQWLAARCEGEEFAGRAAAQRLRDLLNSGVLSLTPVGGLPVASAPALRIVRIDGRDVGAQKVAEGLAVAYASGTRPWCRPLIAERSMTKPA